MRKFLIAMAVAAMVVQPAEARNTYHRHASHYYGPRSGRHYSNVNGNWVHSPMRSHGRPAGATAHCGDGTWSFSQHHRGTCSHHGGVSGW